MERPPGTSCVSNADHPRAGGTRRRDSLWSGAVKARKGLGWGLQWQLLLPGAPRWGGGKGTTLPVGHARWSRRLPPRGPKESDHTGGMPVPSSSFAWGIFC